jgi:hypothetical protein
VDRDHVARHAAYLVGVGMPADTPRVDFLQPAFFQGLSQLRACRACCRSDWQGFLTRVLPPVVQPGVWNKVVFYLKWHLLYDG